MNKRDIFWVRRCRRALKECLARACMQSIDADRAIESCEALAREGDRRNRKRRATGGHAMRRRPDAEKNL